MRVAKLEEQEERQPQLSAHEDLPKERNRLLVVGTWHLDPKQEDFALDPTDVCPY